MSNITTRQGSGLAKPALIGGSVAIAGFVVIGFVLGHIWILVALAIAFMVGRFSKS